MKKLLALFTAAALFFTSGLAASAQTTNSNDISATLNAGSLQLIVDETAELNFSATLDSSEVLTATSTDSVDWSVEDFTGKEHTWNVQQTIADFVHEDGNTKLTPLFEVNTPEVIHTSELGDRTASGVIDLGGSLEFDNKNFNKAGNYSSTLTTEVVVMPEA
uniref:hypothetical protein n=1 Tax=uncultured Allobacillus sp. TaxID=1638025 RepID=UPI0025914A38|nr:hypothetical protein [uncultured Allobacillus sp.]